MTHKILFICKYNANSLNEEYSDGCSYGFHRKFSGLYNSARFINSMLNVAGFKSEIVNAIDNNCIDRLVTENKPNTVIIEAFWVVPEKFIILAKLHPTVKFVVRVHSEIPFLACEGMAIDWISRYLKTTNVILAPNSSRAYEDILSYAYHLSPDYADRIIYLPNYYSNPDRAVKHVPINSNEVHIGCFGAIRPLKNQLTQACAAIKFADDIGKRLVFHINGTRVEGQGQPVLHNIRHIFQHSPNHTLVEHSWLPHDKFMELVATMDFGMQCSFTETFNIVAADMVSVDVPMVVSSEVTWLPMWVKADPTSVGSIVRKLKLVNFLRKVKAELVNKVMLGYHTQKAKLTWIFAVTNNFVKEK